MHALRSPAVLSSFVSMRVESSGPGCGIAGGISTAPSEGLSARAYRYTRYETTFSRWPSMSRRTLLHRIRKLLLDSIDSTNISCGVAGGVRSTGDPETCVDKGPTFPSMSL